MTFRSNIIITCEEDDSSRVKIEYELENNWDSYDS